MSGWLDEIGTAKLTDTELKLTWNVLKAFQEAAGDEFTDKDRQEFMQKIDTALYNIKEFKKIAEKL